MEYEDRITINNTEFVVHWSIDVDSPVVESCTVDTAEGSCIFWALELPVKEKIKRFLRRRMDEMIREKAAWKGQYNNV